MKFLSALFTETRGSVGGSTFSRNRGGLYVRARAIPVNPQSSFQVAVRNAMSNVTARWRNTLTQEQRQGWLGLAHLLEFPDSMGQLHKISGLALYVKANAIRVQLNLAPADSVANWEGIPTLNPLTFAIDAADDEVDVTFDDTQEWCDEDGSVLAIYASRPMTQSIEYFKGPYRLAGVIAGDSTTPPSSPASIALPFAVEAGDKVFVQARLTRVGGGLSSPFRGSGIAV